MGFARPVKRDAPVRLRALSGTLCAGLGVLALALGGAWLLATAWGGTGPRPELVVGHLAAAAVALALQWVAERHPGRAGAVAAGGVILVGVLVGILFWWS
jgi:hypothetical protein